ncbi:MAG: glycosyltransferase family 1 protein [Alphaproteobacteria bacterium]|nr:glycosyltransferase family 1 protein [Alphaproteobacteria bacterium]
MRLALVTDAWFPQVNGVVRTLDQVRLELEALGHDVHVLSPDLFTTIPCPSYPEIRLTVRPGRRISRLIEAIQPEAIHIATEGPLGLAVRRWCLRRGHPFTTSFHTRFPEYIRARLGLPLALGYAALRRFHRPATGVLVATATLHRELERRGFRNLCPWSRGVDTHLFRPQEKAFYSNLPRPVFLYVGRVAVEKNLRAFLDLNLPGSKVVVGDGPQLAELKRAYEGVHFAGAQNGEVLAGHYTSADVFVFPSRTDTFGLVLLEALACGLPVAAYPVAGPIDVIDGANVGMLHEDLGVAARNALKISPERCRDYALRFSWRACAEQFLACVEPIR